MHPSKVKQYVLEKEKVTGRNVQERRLFNQYLKKYLKAGGAIEHMSMEHMSVTAPSVRNKMCCNDEYKGWNGEDFDPTTITCSEDVTTDEDSYRKCKTYIDDKCKKIREKNEDTTFDDYEYFIYKSDQQQLGDECEEQICNYMIDTVSPYFQKAMESDDIEQKEKMMRKLVRYATKCEKKSDTAYYLSKLEKVKNQISKLDENIKDEKSKQEKMKEEEEKRKKAEQEGGVCAIM